jgi:translocation protein SEC63
MPDLPWPQLTYPGDTVLRIDCRCTGCQQKAALLAEQRKQKLWEPKTIRRYVLLAVGWAIVGYMSYCIATTKIENEIWDPYSILGISPSTSLEKIKSHYKKLSRAMHPDKIKLVGNITKEEVEARFVDVTKAYKAYDPHL